MRPIGSASRESEVGVLWAVSRRDPRVARIVRAWRALTTPARARRFGSGERTLIACSGGADSSALVLALASASDDLVIAHIVHDLRPEAAALADRDLTRRLTERLGLSFCEARVSVHQHCRSGDANVEAVARRLRYDALLTLAARHGCRFIATAHHADDQLETMLMALVRGAGPRGLAGIATRRRAAASREDGRRGIQVIRPMLGDELGQVRPTTRAEAEAICRAAGWDWSTDSTNADVSLLRNAIRRDVTPVLERLRPGAAVRAARSAPILQSAARAIRRRACEIEAAGTVTGGVLVLPRAALRSESAAVVGEVLRRACGSMRGGRDQLGRRTLAPVVRAIRDGSTEPRSFRAGPLSVSVTARQVRVEGSKTGRKPA